MLTRLPRRTVSNAEILEITYDNDTNAQTWYDSVTDTNYLVYNDTEWVAYMTEDVKNSRNDKWQGLKFAGTVDWAIDLAYFTDDDFLGPDGNCTDCEDEVPPLHPWTPCNDGPFDNLDTLSDDTINGWPIHCRAQYTLESLNGLLKTSMDNYTDMMNNGYDDKFKTYAKAVADSALGQVHDFMDAHGNDYFTCEVVEIQTCCSYCEGGADQCRYCFDGDCYSSSSRRLNIPLIGNTTHLPQTPDTNVSVIDGLRKRGDGGPNTGRTLNVKWENVSEPCPPDYSKRGYGPDDPYEQTIYWTLDSDKADAFYADMTNETGIPKAKIGFGLYTLYDSCGGTGHSPGDGDTCWNTGYEFNAPFPNGYTASDVTDPKDIVSKGLTNAGNLPDQVTSAIQAMQLMSYYGDGSELVDAIALPISMIASGVESMESVVQTADKIDEEKRKAIILAFLSALLFFIPIAGEVIGAVTELGAIADVIALLGVAGNAAMDVYTIVDDPQNAALAIVDLVMAPAALADVAVIAKAANIRRGMADADVARLGDRVGARMGKVEKVTGVCIKSA